MNKQDIIDAAMQIAVGTGNDPHTSPVIDGEMTAEDLLPHAFRHAYKQLLNSGEMRFQDVMREHSIEFDVAAAPYTGLSGPLPEGVLTEYLDHGFLPEYPFSSYLPYISDYQRQRFDALLCYWTVNNETFYTSCVAATDSSEESSEESSDEAATILLHAPSIPGKASK